MLNIGLIFGGPSEERGISINSARSIMDHTEDADVEIVPLYVTTQLEFYKIAKAQLYSNTPSDFDFKLSQLGQKLSSLDLIKILQSMDIVFPVIHGEYGEDGKLQAFLEQNNIPYIGSTSSSCKKMFHKFTASNILAQNGFSILPSKLIDKNTDYKKAIACFFREHQEIVLKRPCGGSSIGVYRAQSLSEAYEKAHHLFDHFKDQTILLEKYCKGKEFTVVVIENQKNEPVALPPTEIECDYHENAIFSYHKKYLPAHDTRHHTPPRWDYTLTERIQTQAEIIYKIFGMRDFARLDGWLLPDNSICFTDLNPISGLEQNSFLFRQASLIGLTHKNILAQILNTALRRTHPQKHLKGEKPTASPQPKHKVYVIFGGDNAERQVSLMSGTNVWLKLLNSSQYTPIPFLYCKDNTVWELPYSYALNHTVEEIIENCNASEGYLKKGQYIANISRKKLHLEAFINTRAKKYTLKTFLEKAKTQEAFIFIALHGEKGENGTFQRILDSYNLPYNGSSEKTSAICMDKNATGQLVNSLKSTAFYALPKVTFHITACPEKIYKKINEVLGTNSKYIIKPQTEGCSAGVILLSSLNDLKKYTQFVQKNAQFIPPHSFINQTERVEVSSQKNYIIEPYIETDKLSLADNKINYCKQTGWVELTVGIMEMNGHYHSLNPSITIAQGNLLTLEEKFQGGTGINLTPPPETIISSLQCQFIKHTTESLSKAFSIKNYARIDLFFNVDTNQILIIEINTLPALTPSTVLFQQALAETPPLAPLELLESIIQNASTPIICTT